MADNEQIDSDVPPPREPIFNIQGIVFALICANLAIHAIRVYLLTPNQDLGLLIRAAFIPIRYSGAYPVDIYSFTSPFTYSLLHGGIDHLAINLVWLAAFGSPLAARLGTARFLLFWCFTALAAAALHYALFPADPRPLIGASGAISGMMGAAARFGFRTDRASNIRAFGGPILSISETLASRTVLAFLGIWFVINLVAGIGFLSPGGSAIAWQAHIGGFVAGFFGIRFFDPGARRAAG